MSLSPEIERCPKEIRSAIFELENAVLPWQKQKAKTNLYKAIIAATFSDEERAAVKALAKKALRHRPGETVPTVDEAVKIIRAVDAIPDETLRTLAGEE